MSPNSFSSGRETWAIVAGLTALAAAGAFLFAATRESKATPAEATPATPVSVALVTETGVSTWDEFSGRMEAVERVEVRARVAGSVHAVHFREGSIVRKGDLLITIDPAPYAAAVERAMAQVTAAQARVTLTTSELDRARRLWSERAIAQREHDERLNAEREAQANLQAAQASLRAAELDLSYTQLRAPVSGRVGKLEVTVGNLVSAGASSPVLTTLVSVDPIYASFEANEQLVQKALKQASHAKVSFSELPVQMLTSFDEQETRSGKLQLVDNQVDARSGTVRLRAVLDNKDGSLMPGQFARLRLGQASEHRALLVSERAIGTDQSKRFVYVVGLGNKVEYREVSLGSAVQGMRIVSSGLRAGERVVVNGVQRVRPGIQVAPTEVPMTARQHSGEGQRVASAS